MTIQSISKPPYIQQLILHFDKLLSTNTPKPKFIKKCLEILNQEKSPLNILEIKKIKLIKKISCENKVIYSIASVFAISVVASFSATVHFFSNNDFQTAFLFLKITTLFIALSGSIDYKNKPNNYKLNILNEAPIKAFIMI